MIITWPSEQSRLEYLQALEETVWRPVTFEYITSISGCSVCSLDPVTETSTDSFCPTCSGEYWIETISGVDINAHVTWKYADGISWFAGGQQLIGDCLIKIIYNSNNYDVVVGSKGVIVDDRDMQINKVNLLGAPTINRITMTLKERDRE